MHDLQQRAGTDRLLSCMPGWQVPQCVSVQSSDQEEGLEQGARALIASKMRAAAPCIMAARMSILRSGNAVGQR